MSEHRCFQPFLDQVDRSDPDQTPLVQLNNGMTESSGQDQFNPVFRPPLGSMDQSILSTNGEMSDIIESYRQKIHRLENERNLLQLRISTVESDYDAQIKDLQSNVVTMRIELSRQKQMYLKIEDERLQLISELTQQNTDMSNHLMASRSNEKSLKVELNCLKAQSKKRKTLIRDNLQLLDSLRSEIACLRDEKVDLQRQLDMLTEERNALVGAVVDHQTVIGNLDAQEQDHLATIQSQDRQISHLQDNVQSLQNQLKHISCQHDNIGRERGLNSGEGQPQRSLLAELAEQRLELLQVLHLDATTGDVIPTDFDLEHASDDVEMDDEVLLAMMKQADSEPRASTSHANPPASDENSNNLDILRMEVLDVYQQMRKMYLEVQALTHGCNNSQNSMMPRRGTNTPDELAMVEMDFRLSSLRSVLGDLRGLLDDLRSMRSFDLIEDESAVDLLEQVEHSIDMDGAQETEEKIRERDALVNEVAAVQEQVTKLRNQLDSDKDRRSASINGRQTFVANWEDIEDDDYEFELPFGGHQPE